MKLINNYSFILLFGMLLTVISCQQPGVNNPGSEYMPDMAHSVAYEANYYSYYYNNTWGTEEEYYGYAMPKEPVHGTIPRGAAGVAKSNSHVGIDVPANGFKPYAYADTEEDRTRASEEITKSPFPISEKGLKNGKNLYDIYCGLCHGEKGDGAGYLVRDDGGKYPVQPANFLLDEFVNASNGRYYHAIIYGKNLMGGYTDKLSHEERWHVIQYIRTLQAKEKGLMYSAKENTFNEDPLFVEEVKETVEIEDVHDHEHNHGENHDHSHDHDHDHHDSH